MLEKNVSYVALSLIANLRDNPTFAEAKIYMLKELVPLMSIDTIKMLLDVCQSYAEPTTSSSDVRNHIIVRNTNYLLVHFGFISLLMCIKDNFPALSNRTQTIRENMIQVEVDISHYSTLSADSLYSVLKTRNMDGENVLALLLKTKPYSFLQVKAVEEAVRIIWRSNINFSNSFLEESTAYRTLFIQKRSKQDDKEALGRSQVLSFNRKDSLRTKKPHGLSYLGIFSRMAVIYQADVFFAAAILIYYQYLVIDTYSIFTTVIPNITTIFMNPTTPPLESLGQEAIDFTIETFE